MNIDLKWWMVLGVVLGCILMGHAEILPTTIKYDRFYELREKIANLSIQNAQKYSEWRNEDLHLAVLLYSKLGKSKLTEESRLGLILMLLYVERVDQLTADYDPKDKPYLNLAPPGGKYMSGIAPEAIKEPEIRDAYIKMLTINKAKTIYRSRCIDLLREKDYLREQFHNFLSSFSDSEFKDQIEPLVASVCSTPEEFQRRLKELRPQPAEKP